MLQMARWLGYRRDYLHLMRIYTTIESQRDMEEIAGAEQDVRNQIELMEAEGKSPREFVIRVRIRQDLLPTRRSAMLNATATAVRRSFASALVETREFPESDTEFKALLERNLHNQQVVQRRLSALPFAVISDTAWRKYTIDASSAVQFINELRFDRNDASLGSDVVPGKIELMDYIEIRQRESELISWDIILCGLQSSKLGAVEVIPGVGTFPIERGREFYGPDSTSRISNLSEGKDEHTAATDAERILAESATPKPISKFNGKSYRSLRDPKVGRIFIYPISAFSNEAAKGGGKGKPLFASSQLSSSVNGGYLLAFGISFPGSQDALSDITEYFNNSVS